MLLFLSFAGMMAVAVLFSGGSQAPPPAYPLHDYGSPLHPAEGLMGQGQGQGAADPAGGFPESTRGFPVGERAVADRATFATMASVGASDIGGVISYSSGATLLQDAFPDPLGRGG